MKKILMYIGVGYLGIGLLMGSITALSYLYAQYFVLFSIGWSIFSLSGLSFLMFSGYQILITPIIKTFLWLPSLIMWFYEPGIYSFWMWLAPGFFAESGSG